MNKYEILENLKDIISTQVSLFDKSGGIINIKGSYVKDWWNLPSIILTQANQKYIFVRDYETGSNGKFKISQILDVSEQEITLDL